MPVGPKCLLPHIGNAIFAKGSFVRKIMYHSFKFVASYYLENRFLFWQKQRRGYRGVEFCGAALMICFTCAADGFAE